jgi:hypothetical protein
VSETPETVTYHQIEFPHHNGGWYANSMSRFGTLEEAVAYRDDMIGMYVVDPEAANRYNHSRIVEVTETRKVVA